MCKGWLAFASKSCAQERINESIESIESSLGQDRDQSVYVGIAGRAAPSQGDLHTIPITGRSSYDPYQPLSASGVSARVLCALLGGTQPPGHVIIGA